MRLVWRKNRLYWEGVRKSLAYIKPLPGKGFSGRQRWEYKVEFMDRKYFLLNSHTSFGVAYREEDARCACVTIVLDRITDLIKESQ